MMGLRPARRSRALTMAVAGVLAVGAWLLWSRDGGERRGVASSAGAPDRAAASDAGGSSAPEPADGAMPPGGARGTELATPPAVDAAAPPASSPSDDLDGPSWRSSRLAFRPRELGKLGPYVKAGLDAARRDMEFCYRQAASAPASAPRSAEPAEESDDEPSPSQDPAVLLLYLEARDGALDVVEARTEYAGSLPRELVACCREVLRGRQIPAFGAEPGRRYRLKYRLPR